MMKSFQERANTLIQQGNAARDNGRRAEAARAYREAIDLVPAYGTLYLAVAELLLEEDRYGEAADAYREAAAFAPDNADAWTGLGKCQLRMDNYDEAVAAFQTALDVQPRNPEASYYSALLLGMQGDWKEAEKRLVTALTQRPGWESQARREASLKPVFESSRRLANIGRQKKWWEFWR